MKFEVVLHQPGCDQTIDVIIAPKGYMAADYVADCERNGDQEYVKLLKTGEVELVKVNRKE